MAMHDPGMIRLLPRCYLSDIAGRLLDEITDHVVGGEVSVDLDADVPMTFRFELRESDLVPAWSWVRPFLALSWFDATTRDFAAVDEPVGHFFVLPASERHTAAMGMQTVEAVDGCWRLRAGCYETAPRWGAGANVVDAIKLVLTDSGIPANRIQIPARSNTFSKRRAYDPGTNRLEIVNDLLMRVGYYPLWFDRAGIARSRKIKPLSTVEPRREITSANGDVVGLVELEADPERLCNRVVVTGTDPKADTPIVVSKSNRRADSSVSIANLGFVKSRLIEGGNVETVADATDLANEALEEGASVDRRVRLSTLPDPAFGLRETIRLNIDRDDGPEVVDGRWTWTKLRIGFSPREQPQTWELQRLQRWSEDF